MQHDVVWTVPAKASKGTLHVASPVSLLANSPFPLGFYESTGLYQGQLHGPAGNDVEEESLGESGGAGAPVSVRGLMKTASAVNEAGSTA